MIPNLKHINIVWKQSNNIGIGMSLSSSPDSDDMYWLSVVVDFDPPGNIKNQFIFNVESSRFF